MSYRLLDFSLRVAFQPVALPYFLAYVLTNTGTFVRPVATFWFYTQQVSITCVVIQL